STPSLGGWANVGQAHSATAAASSTERNCPLCLCIATRFGVAARRVFAVEQAAASRRPRRSRPGERPVRRRVVGNAKVVGHPTAYRNCAADSNSFVAGNSRRGPQTVSWVVFRRFV